ncbi:MAG: M1 family metallopeptidase [Cellvibrionaceae bacterium]
MLITLTRRQCLLFFILFATLLTACSDAPPPEPEVSSAAAPLGRLPDTVEPLHYRLRLTIDPRRERFAGETAIDIHMAEPGDTIWLHGLGLDVTALSASLADGEVMAGEYEQVADVGVAKLTFPNPLPRGKATLSFHYSAPFNTSLEGLYKVTAGGEDYAFTQFEATSARFAFPGFDEPAFKVPFDITLEVNANHTAVTSTPAVEEGQLDNGNRQIRYQTTEPLPTYLIAFAVGPLDQRAGEPIAATPLRETPIPFTAYAVQGKGDQLRFALENTEDIVLAQEEYFGHAYPFEKLGIIAVPDFGAGAMENVGAITYREQYLLQSEATPVAMQQRFILVHAHELAHQWFGNLVTPEWWDDIWLNEAFATWMATKTMDQLQPEAGYRQRMLDSALSTMEMDRLVSARQIRQPVVSHQDIGAAFDGITYQKGGAVLSMLEGFIGEQDFKRGIQHYMTQHRFGNADARDFVRAIAATRNDLPEGQVEAAFFSFLEQPGTPLVDLGWQCDEEESSATVRVEQSRYLPVGSLGDPDKTWLLPLCIAFEDNGERRQHCELISEQEQDFQVGIRSCPGAIIPNADASGYYRWTMAEALWETLLNGGILNERERLAAANSLSGDFHAGGLDARQYFALLPLLLNTDNAQVASTPLDDVYLIEQHMVPDQHRAEFRALVAELYRPIYQSVSLDKALEDADQIRLRVSMLQLFALLVEDEAVREQLHELATRYIDFDANRGFDTDRQLHPEVLDSNIREVALSTAVAMEGRAFADLLLSHFHNSDNAVLREEILRALTESKDSQFRAELRALSLSDQLRDNEVGHIIEPLMDKAESRDETWQWLRANLDAVVERSPSWFQGRVIEYADNFCSESRYEEIDRELSEKITSLQRGSRSLANTLEEIRLCAALVEEQGPSVQVMLGGVPP